MKIKICGMREQGNIRALVQLNPDYMGLIFYPGSKRYVQESNSGILESLKSQIKVTGVFVNESEEVISTKVKQYQLKAVQLHGQESPEYCLSLQDALDVEYSGVEIIKAFGLDEDFDFDVLQSYDRAVDYFLFDTKTPAHGGSGLKFNWEILKNYHLEKPYFLSGGIDLTDLEALKKLEDGRLYAVDLNSKFEISPALKDIEKVSEAIKLIRFS
jgi:phosphoribosylanthranilate isomerase